MLHSVGWHFFAAGWADGFHRVSFLDDIILVVKFPESSSTRGQFGTLSTATFWPLDFDMVTVRDKYLEEVDSEILLTKLVVSEAGSRQ